MSTFKSYLINSTALLFSHSTLKNINPILFWKLHLSVSGIPFGNKLYRNNFLGNCCFPLDFMTNYSKFIPFGHQHFCQKNILFLSTSSNLPQFRTHKLLAVIPIQASLIITHWWSPHPEAHSSSSPLLCFDILPKMAIIGHNTSVLYLRMPRPPDMPENEMPACWS